MRQTSSGLLRKKKKPRRSEVRLRFALARIREMPSAAFIASRSGCWKADAEDPEWRRTTARSLSALSSIKVPTVGRRRAFASRDPIVGRQNNIKSKNKIIGNQRNIRRLHVAAAAVSAASVGRCKQARSSRMLACLPGCLSRAFCLSSCPADGQLLIALCSLNGFSFFVSRPRRLFALNIQCMRLEKSQKMLLTVSCDFSVSYDCSCDLHTLLIILYLWYCTCIYVYISFLSLLVFNS